MTLLAISLLSSITLSQSKIISYSGSFSITHDYYSTNGSEQRFPKNYSKAILNTTFVLFDQIQLPFEYYLASDQSKFQQPFNQFGVSPQITDWLTLHAGYFSAKISDLTFGDQRLDGGGIELKPGDFRLYFLYGTSQKSIERDSMGSGTYKRNIMTAKLGYGSLDDFYTNINFVHVLDDSTSLKKDTTGSSIKPLENTAVTLDLGFKISDVLKFSAEAGVAAFTNNIYSDKVKDGINVPSFLFTPRLSSQFDGALKVCFDFTPHENWQIQLDGKWIGPGYVTLGYGQMPNDVFEITLSPTVKLFEKNLLLKGSFGARQNNLRNNRLSTTNNTVVSLFAGAQLTQELGLDIQFNNNQIKSNNKNDSIKVSNIFNFVSLAPRYSFNALGGLNNIVLNYSYQEVQDQNPVTGPGAYNQTNSLTLMHAIVFPSSINLTTNIFYTRINAALSATEIVTFSETFGYQLFENKLNTSLTMGYNIENTGSRKEQITGKLSAVYQTEGWGSFQINVSCLDYKGAEEYDQSYKELQINLQYQINF